MLYTNVLSTYSHNKNVPLSWNSRGIHYKLCRASLKRPRWEPEWQEEGAEQQLHRMTTLAERDEDLLLHGALGTDGLLLS